MVPLLGLTRYTEPAQQVLVLAEQQALADGDPAISTGDMLLGLLRADRGVATGVLESLGITAEAVRIQLEEITHPDEDGASSYGISRRITLTRMGMGSCRRPSWPWVRPVTPRRVSRERLRVPTYVPERCWWR